MTFSPSSINGIDVWIDSQTGVTGTNDGAISAITNQVIPGGGPPPVSFTSAFRTGTNLVGLESVTYDQYTPAAGPPTSNYPVYTSTLLNTLQTNKVSVARITLAWEALQSSLGGQVPASTSGNYGAYWNNLITTIQELLSRNICIILEPWGYNAVIQNTDICYRGAAFTSAQFAEFWGPFATSINVATNSDQRVAFGLMNEPHTADNGPPGSVGITLANWFACAQAAITAIRNTGATNAILISGMDYADPVSFLSDGSSTQFLTLTDPLKNIVLSVHNYNGIGSNSNTVLVDTMSPLVSWATTNGVKIHVSETALDAGQPNGTLALAQAQWANWVTYSEANTAILLGDCWWAAGEAGWWSTSDSSSGYNWGLLADNSDTMLSVYGTLIQSSLGTIGGNGNPPDNFSGISPNRPVWRTFAGSGAPYGFDNGAYHSISFEGSPDFLTLGTILTLAAGSSYWAVVKFTANVTTAGNTQNCPMTLFGDWNTSSSSCQVGFSSGSLRVRCLVGSTWTSYTSKSTTLNNGKIHFIAVTHDTAGNLNFYIDGTLTDTFTKVTYDTKTTFSLVGSGYNKKDPFIGQAAELMVFNSVLASSDVTNLYNRAKALWVD